MSKPVQKRHEIQTFLSLDIFLLQKKMNCKEILPLQFLRNIMFFAQPLLCIQGLVKKSDLKF